MDVQGKDPEPGLQKHLLRRQGGGSTDLGPGPRTAPLTCALRQHKTENAKDLIEGYNTHLSIASRSEMLHREPFRSQVYKPFLSIWLLCLRGRCPAPPPLPPCCFGFVPVFSKVTLEPRGGLPCLRRFLSVGPELPQTSCSSSAVPLLEGHCDCRCSDRWRTGAWVGTTRRRSVFLPRQERQPPHPHELASWPFPPVLPGPHTLIGLPVLLQLRLLFKRCVWSIRASWGLSDTAGS